MKLWNIWYQTVPKQSNFRLYDCVYKTQVLFKKAHVILGANIVWLASHSGLLVNLSIISYADNSSVNKTDDSFLLLKPFAAIFQWAKDM